MADLNSADILGVDWARRAREILAGAQPSRPKEKDPPEMWRGGTFRLEPVEIREKNAVTDPDSWLNRGLRNILENSVDAILGEGTGNTALDMARTAKTNELVDASKTKKARKAQMEANKMLVYKKLPPGYRALVDERAEAEAVLARQKALELGASEVEANKKYRGRKQSVISSYTNEIVKSLGFKNASDPRLFTEDIPDIVK